MLEKGCQVTALALFHGGTLSTTEAATAPKVPSLTQLIPDRPLTQLFHTKTKAFVLQTAMAGMQFCPTQNAL